KDLPVKTRLCRIYRDENDIPKTRELAVDILEQAPENEEALLILADTAITSEEIADIELRVQRLRSQSGDRALFHLVAGMRWVRRKALEKAELAFRKAASLDPKSSFACRALGNVYAVQGKMADAQGEYEKEVQLAPQDLFARMRLADFKVRIGSLS